MAAPSAIAAALQAADRSPRTAHMAATMMRYEASYGGCTNANLAAEGFVEAEIAAYFDDAVAIIHGRPCASAITPATAAARAEGLALVERARLKRADNWRKPVVVETQARRC